METVNSSNLPVLDGENALSIAHSLTWRYVIALVLVASLSTAAWFSLHLVITEQASTAAVVNVSGRQRMLSQRTALFANLLVTAPAAERPLVRKKLQDALELMSRSHWGLVHGDESMGLPATMSAVVHGMYYAGPAPLDTQVTAYLQAVQLLLEDSDGTITADHPMLRYITSAAPNQLVTSLDKMVKQYQLEGEASVKGLQKAETIFWLVTLLLLALEAALIFHPFIRHVRAVISKLQGVTQELRSHQDNLQDMIAQRTTELESRTRQLAESEETFRLISTAAKDAIVIIDQDQRIAYWNPAAEQIFAYPAAEAIGKNLHHLLAPAQHRPAAAGSFANFRLAGQGQRVGKTFETTALRKSGEEFPIELSISAIFLRNNWHAVGIIRDISDRKRNEQELEQHRLHLEGLVEERTAGLSLAKEAAEAASRAKSTFLANMSHELRTPLNAILGMTKMALRHATLPVQHTQLDKVAQASQHLLGVINDILDVSKIEAGHLILEQVNFQLSEVLDKLRLLIASRIEEKGLCLCIEAVPSLVNLPLQGDPLRLGQVLLNLAGNAIKFTEQGSIAVRLLLLEDSPLAILMRCEISDTGIGISRENQQRLFTAFEQADGSMTRKYGGTGLGLAICKQLVQLMGGEIGLDSQPGQGSTFWFTVRLDKASSPLVAPVPEPDSGQAEATLKSHYAGTRVLLVEDEPINQEVSRGMLEDVDFSIDLAEDGAEAVQMASEKHYQLILMDMQMPKLNGTDATRAIRQLPGYASIPILAMTANAFDDDRQACLDAGMNDHIAKPVDPDKLFATLLKWLSLANPSAE